jgi:hypothetical protein
MSVALPKEKTQPSRDLTAKTTLLYGPPKIGKSSLASKFPGAVFLDLADFLDNRVGLHGAPPVNSSGVQMTGGS